MADNRFLSTDVYGTNDYVNAIKKRFIPDVPEDTLMLGIFGYMGQVFSDMMQNSIIMASELSNESIPTKAKFEKNIIAHALGLGITDINAIPAQMDVLLTFIEDDIINWANARDENGNEQPWTFVFDKDTPIFIGDHSFYVDYDIEIKKIRVHNPSSTANKFTYTARYLIDVDNPISDISNPYLSAPVRMAVNGIHVLFTKCTLRQVSKQTIHKKVLSDNSISAKTATFTFEGQLAAFTVDVVEGDTTTHLIPVYDGLSVEDNKYPYIYYSYLSTNTIRIKFDKESYMPRINSDVYINLHITEGENGNFTYKPTTYPSFSFESERYGYSSIGCEIRPITGESLYGMNKKSIDELKRIIPKEALSRGSISSTSDLQNYFNAIDTDDSVIHIYKKRDNALERLYYMYILMRDANNGIIPTNTIDIKIRLDALNAENGRRVTIKKNQILGLNRGEQYATTYSKGDSNTVDFRYNTPYNIVINMDDPMYAMYYMPAVDTNKFLEFAYINGNSQYQFIATSAKLYRSYSHSDSYTISVDIEQNVHINKSDLEFDDNGNVIKTNIRCIAVFYNDQDAPVRWSEAVFESCITEADIFTFKFTLGTKDLISVDNKLRIDTGLYNINTEEESYAYFASNEKCVIYILNKQDDNYGNSILSGIVPNIEEYTVCNSYNVVDGIDFFYDYSDIVNSTVLIGQDDTSGGDDGGDEGGDDSGLDIVSEDGTTTTAMPVLPSPNPGGGNIELSKPFNYLIIKSVPVVKYGYLNTEKKTSTFCNEIVRRKSYAEHLVNILEDLFGVDFKFFNTYGPSKLFTIDNGTTCIDRVNINLTFRLKLAPVYDTNVVNDIEQYIRQYVENINSIKSIHMSNLASEVTTKFRDHIEYFEFVSINQYDSTVRHIYASEIPDELIVPEFLNISSDYISAPPISIIVE